MAAATGPATTVQPAPPSGGVSPWRKATIAKRYIMTSYAVASALGGQNDWLLPSKGYLRKLKIVWSGTETTATADPGAVADFPYNLAKRLELRDNSGGMAANLKGYSAEIAKRFFIPNAGRILQDSADARVYRANISIIQANNINFSHVLDVEAGTRDNLGTLPNQNAAFQYTLTLTVESTANVVGTAANWSASALTAQPTMYYYTVPSPTRTDGLRQAVNPPFARIVRQVYDQNVPINTAAETPYQITTGKVIRNLCIVMRNSSNARIGTLSRCKILYGDDTVLFDATEQELIDEVYRLYGVVPPTGVYPIPFTADNDSFVGADYRRDILDTRRLSQLYMLLTFSTTGNFDLIHDELIVPAGMSI